LLSSWVSDTHTCSNCAGSGAHFWLCLRLLSVHPVMPMLRVQQCTSCPQAACTVHRSWHTRRTCRSSAPPQPVLRLLFLLLFRCPKGKPPQLHRAQRFHSVRLQSCDQGSIKRFFRVSIKVATHPLLVTPAVCSACKGAHPTCMPDLVQRASQWDSRLKCTLTPQSLVATAGNSTNCERTWHWLQAAKALTCHVLCCVM
jgi:hypothetical protein